ncbi:MAG: CcdB family protein [Xanthomonadales bacterium]|nr:CcdB family protein [Xanthomonadales bacterium]
MVVRRFDVFENPSRRESRAFPYVLVVQSELLDEMATRVVLPLTPVRLLHGKPVARLHPRVEIDGESFVVFTHLLGTLPTQHLKKRIANLGDQQHAFVAALDHLFSGI